MKARGSLVRRVWKRLDLVQPLIVAGVVLLGISAVPRERFSDLQPGERLVVQQVTHGCFGGSRARFTFTPEADGLRYTSFSADWPAGHQTSTGILTREQVARLDAGMDRFSATVARGGCSRLTRATLTRFVHGIPVSHNSFVHRWCGGADGELNLAELLPKLK